MNEQEFEDKEFPEYESDIEPIILLYLAFWKQVNSIIGRLLSLSPSATNQQMILERNRMTTDIAKVFYSFNRGLSIEVSELISTSYYEGRSYSKYSLDDEIESVEDAKEDLKFTRDEESRLRKRIEIAQTELLQATHNTEESIKKLIRESVSAAMQSTDGRNEKVRDIADKIRKEIEKKRLEQKLDRANIAIIDKAGRRWKLDTYINMVSKTTANNVYMQGIRDQAEKDGSDLAIISTKPDTVDACLNYEGMIISLNGKTKGYLTYDYLKSTNLVFHPNCGHFCRPVAGEDFIPPAYRETHEQQMKKFNRNKDNIRQQTKQDSPK